MLPPRILVLCPHPDDEVLMTAGLIRRCVTEQREIFVALATNGDYLCPNQEKGRRRLAESLEALGLLGLAQNRVFFLGYPDTGMAPEESFLGRLAEETNPDRVFPAAHGGGSYGIPGVKEDYHSQRLGRPAQFCRRDFLDDLQALLRECAPQLVITSSRYDRHGDHVGLSRLVCQALLTQNLRPLLWESLVHSPAGDEAWPTPARYDQAFEMPPHLEEDCPLRWDKRISLPVPPEMAGAHGVKLQAINAYHTALNPSEPEVCAYLRAFSRIDEIFWPMPY